jgi:hypothetical protein
MLAERLSAHGHGGWQVARPGQGILIVPKDLLVIFGEKLGILWCFHFGWHPAIEVICFIIQTKNSGI